MTIGGTAIIVGLLGVALAQAEQGEPQVLLDYQPESGGGDIAGCLRPALRSVGIDWSLEYLQGFLGQAFVFSMNEDGGRLKQADNHQWSYFYEMVGFLPIGHINASLKGKIAVSPEMHDQTKKEAWDKVRASIDAGYPAIVWQPMSKEQRESGKRPLPFLWALIVAYDDVAGTYTVRHSSSGESVIGWGVIGHADPINWLSVFMLQPPMEPIDLLVANRRALARAIESSQGKYPGASASTHGLAAYETWLTAFRSGTVSVNDVGRHADFLAKSRTTAAIYLSEIRPLFPEQAQQHLQAAVDNYDDEIDAISELRALCATDGADMEAATEILSRALAHERAALVAIQRALDAF